MSKLRETRDEIIKNMKEKERYTDEELAVIFNLTRERIRQIVRGK